jgi:hypothetical protein
LKKQQTHQVQGNRVPNQEKEYALPTVAASHVLRQFGATVCSSKAAPTPLSQGGKKTQQAICLGAIRILKVKVDVSWECDVYVSRPVPGI